MSDIAVRLNRDAARIARQEARKATATGRMAKASFWDKQSTLYELEANKAEAIFDFRTERDELVFLLLREAVTQNWKCGYIGTDGLASIYINHPFCGLLYWNVPRESIPNWVPIYTGPMAEIDEESMYKQIDRYLRSVT